MKNPHYTVTKEQHLQELIRRVTPIINVNVIVRKGEHLLLGRHAQFPGWLFPGSRMLWNETPQETALRVLKNEVPGVTASLKKFVAINTDHGWDSRAYGVNLYYLCDYISGEPISNENLQDFRWVGRDAFITSEDIYQIEKDLAQELDIAIRSINISEDEVLVEVDENDKEIGKITKKEAHKTSSRFHRAAHIMIFTSKGEVILQQRSWNKMTGPGKWDMPGGHQVYGQTIEQCAASELMEEMGVSVELNFVRKGLYQSDSQSEFYYLFTGISDGPYGFDKNEVEQIRIFDCEKLLRKEYSESDNVYEHVYGYIEELRPFWQKLAKPV